MGEGRREKGKGRVGGGRGLMMRECGWGWRWEMGEEEEKRGRSEIVSHALSCNPFITLNQPHREGVGKYRNRERRNESFFRSHTTHLVINPKPGRSSLPLTLGIDDFLPLYQFVISLLSPNPASSSLLHSSYFSFTSKRIWWMLYGFSDPVRRRTVAWRWW